MKVIVMFELFRMDLYGILSKLSMNNKICYNLLKLELSTEFIV